MIGIVAALTIPNMMNNSNGEEFRAGFKKSVLSLKQAVRLHYLAGGLSPLKYSNNTDLINDLFKTRMNVLEVKNNPFKSGYRMTDCDFTNKGNPVCTEYTPDISNTIITQDGYIYYFVENKRADGAIPIVVDVNGQRRPNKPTINKNEPKDQYTLLLYDDIYITQKTIKDPDPGCTEPSCYACNDPSCFCTDPSCYECTDDTCPCTDPSCEPTYCTDPSCCTAPSCTECIGDSCDPVPECTDPSCTQTPDPGCTEPSCGSQPTEPTYEPTVEPTYEPTVAPTYEPTYPTEPTQDTTPTEPTEETEEQKCTPQSKPVNCIAGSYAADGCTYNCTQYCTKQSIPANCIAGSYAADGCTYNCTQYCTKQSIPANCTAGYYAEDGCTYNCTQTCTKQSIPANCIKGSYAADGCTYNCTKTCTNEAKPSDCEDGYNKDDCSYVCTKEKVPTKPANKCNYANYSVACPGYGTVKYYNSCTFYTTYNTSTKSYNNYSCNIWNDNEDCDYRKGVSEAVLKIYGIDYYDCQYSYNSGHSSKM